MRIVAGKFRSLKVETVEGMNTRPTADRIKEAVFSSIGPYFYGGNMLDCYGGSGNVGFEALSRGMDHVDSFEIDKKAITCIQKNIRKLKVEKNYDLHQQDVWTGIESLQRQYDLIYVDPPYAKQKNKELIEKIAQLNLLSEDGILIVESAKEDRLDQQIGPYVCIKEKTYGITRISYYERKQYEKSNDTGKL